MADKASLNLKAIELETEFREAMKSAGKALDEIDPYTEDANACVAEAMTWIDIARANLVLLQEAVKKLEQD